MFGRAYPWTSKQLTEAIERCEADVEGLRKQGADEGLIADRQHGINIMKMWLDRAKEHEANAEGESR